MSYTAFGLNLRVSRGSFCDKFTRLAHRDDEAEHFYTGRIQGKLMLNYADEQARSLAEEEAHYGNSAYAHGNVSAIHNGHNEKHQLLRRIQYHDFAAEHFGGNVSRTFNYIVNHNDYKPAQLRMKLWFAVCDSPRIIAAYRRPPSNEGSLQQVRPYHEGYRRRNQDISRWLYVTM